MRRYILVILGSVFFVFSLYGAFKVGEVKTKQREREALGFSALWTVQPAIQIIEFSEKNVGSIPEIILMRAHGSVSMVANLSFLFAKDPLRLNEDSQNVLCAIAKNRERYRKVRPDIYDASLMEHLANIERKLTSNNARLSCTV